VFTLISHKDRHVCDGNEGVVCDVQFGISRKHSPELLDITEVTFNNIPPLVQILVILPLSISGNKWCSSYRSVWAGLAIGNRSRHVIGGLAKRSGDQLRRRLAASEKDVEYVLWSILSVS
jgi:hypothetical protein